MFGMQSCVQCYKPKSLPSGKTGYTCSLAGDFNGHIRADSQGIPGNSLDINSNGRLIRNFVSDNGLRIVNGDSD